VYRELVLEKQIAVEADGGIDDVFVYDGPTQMTSAFFQSRKFPARTLSPHSMKLFVRLKKRNHASEWPLKVK